MIDDSKRGNDKNGGAKQGGGPLAELLAYMASQKPLAEGGSAVQDPAVDVGAAQKNSQAEPAQLDYFRELWADVNASRQLRQSWEKVPDNAGPLNSSHLVYRALSLMQTLSPGYLQHFLAHLEALSWMEPLAGGGEAGKEPTRPGAARKGARGR